MTKLEKIYSPQEIKIFKRLNTPKKIQDFLNALPINFEKHGETCYSPRMVLKHKTAHCMEGAMLAAAALEFHGRPPVVLDLRSSAHDFDHVVAVFKQFGCYGAISKTNHAVLRYREPVYKTLRELALSYFHEYFTDSGQKTLREFSKLLDLRYFDKKSSGFKELPPPPSLKKRGSNWRTSEKNLFEIPIYLDEIKHFQILSKQQIKNLRKADKIEIMAGKLVEWKKR